MAASIRKIATPKMSILSIILNTLRLKPKVEVENGQAISKFYRDHLEQGKNLYIAAGELGFMVDDSALLDVFESSLKKGIAISILAGPEIKPDSDGSNPLIDLLERNYENFSLLYLDKHHASKFHFAIAGRDVFMENPHTYEASAEEKRVEIIYDSVARRYNCTEIFKALVKQSQQLPPEKLREYIKPETSAPDS